MESIFWKTAAGILLSVILILAVEKQERGLAVVLTMVVCCMSAGAAFALLEPVLDLLHTLASMTIVDDQMMERLLKITGTGIMTELAAMICQDSGNASLAKALQLLGSCAILWLSIPVLESLMSLVQDIMGGI